MQYAQSLEHDAVQELTYDELDQASGGFLPVIGFALSLAGHVAGSTGPVTWAISSGGLIVGSWSLAEYLSSV